jgi:hypothetical protein
VTFDPPSGFLDATHGLVLLRLIPFHLDRLHGPDISGDRTNADHLGFDLPFPFLRDAAPIDLSLRAGITPAAIARKGGGFERNSSLGATSWWRWASYALTPFGWVPFPVAFFNDGALSGLSLRPHGGSREKNFLAMRSWLDQEIGEATSGAAEGPVLWKFAWGTVTLSFEPRDDQAQLRVAWDALQS